MDNKVKQIKLKHLIQYLTDLETFENPKVHFEQYQTEPKVAAELLHNIMLENSDFQSMHILDLGCGPGILGIGAAICGAEYNILINSFINLL